MQYSQPHLSFTISYILGIIVGIVIAISQLLPSEALPIFGLAHLLFLVCFGFIMPHSIKEQVGNRIQTAGYLHTLIGFSSALILLGTDQTGQGNLNDVLYPLGSALSTSIVGWLLGGEISSLGENYQQETIRSEFQKLTDELRDFTGAVQEVHTAYFNTMKQLYQNYSQLQEEQETLLKRHQEIQAQIIKETQDFQQEILKTNAEASANLNQLFDQSTEKLKTLESLLSQATEDMQAIEPLLDSFAQLKNNSDLATNNLGEVAQAGRRTAQYLNESRALMTELENLLEYITSVKNNKY